MSKKSKLRNEKELEVINNFVKLPKKEVNSLSPKKREIYEEKKAEYKRVKRKRRWRRILKVLLVLLIIIGVLVGGAYLYFTKVEHGKMAALSFVLGSDTKKQKNLGRIDILVMGESGVGDGWKLADSIMVASYEPQKQRAYILSIPRDTYIGSKAIKSASTNYLQSYKMNAAYRNGTNIPETVKLVSNVTGIELSNYIVIDTDALIKVVDEIGGVWFEVPMDMDYDDPTQDLHIHLKEGYQKLNGEQAEMVCRFRHNNDGSSYPTEYGDNDYGRMRTQRDFIKTTMKQLLNVNNLTKINALLDIIFGSITTNIDEQTIKDYVPFLVEFDSENIKSAVLPGASVYVNEVWIFQHDKNKTADVVANLYSDSSESLEALEELIESPASVDASTKGKVEIINNSGSDAKAYELAKKLKEAGFAIVDYSNSDGTVSKTSIVNRTNKESDELILSTIGVGKVEKGSEEGGIDYSIILGKDYNENSEETKK